MTSEIIKSTGAGLGAGSPAGFISRLFGGSSPLPATSSKKTPSPASYRCGLALRLRFHHKPLPVRPNSSDIVVSPAAGARLS